MDSNNFQLWKDFLQPLKGIKNPKKQTYKFEDFDAYPCLSTDLACLLNPQVLVDEDVVPDIFKPMTDEKIVEKDVSIKVDSGEHNQGDGRGISERYANTEKLDKTVIVIDSSSEGEGEENSGSAEKEHDVLNSDQQRDDKAVADFTDNGTILEECNEGVENQVKEKKQLPQNMSLHSQDTVHVGSQSEEELSSFKDDLEETMKQEEEEGMDVELVEVKQEEAEETKYHKPEEFHGTVVKEEEEAITERIPPDTESEEMNVSDNSEEHDKADEEVLDEDKIFSVQKKTEQDEECRDNHVQLDDGKDNPDLVRLKDGQEEDSATAAAADEATQQSGLSFCYSRASASEGKMGQHQGSQNIEGMKSDMARIEEHNKCNETVDLYKITETEAETREDRFKEKSLEDSGVIVDELDMESEEYSDGKEGEESVEKQNRDKNETEESDNISSVISSDEHVDMTQKEDLEDEEMTEQEEEKEMDINIKEEKKEADETKHYIPGEFDSIEVKQEEVTTERILPDNDSGVINLREYKGEDDEKDEEDAEEEYIDIQQTPQSLDEDRASSVEKKSKQDEGRKDFHAGKDKSDHVRLKDWEEEENAAAAADDDKEIQESDKSFDYSRESSTAGEMGQHNKSQNMEDVKLGIVRVEEHNKVDETEELYKITETEAETREARFKEKSLEDSGIIVDEPDMESKEYLDEKEGKEREKEEENSDKNEFKESDNISSAMSSDEHVDMTQKEDSEEEEIVDTQQTPQSLEKDKLSSVQRKTEQDGESKEFHVQSDEGKDKSVLVRLKDREEEVIDYDNTDADADIETTQESDQHHEEDEAVTEVEGDVEEKERYTDRTQPTMGRRTMVIKNSPEEMEDNRRVGFDKKEVIDKEHVDLNTGHINLLDNVVETRGSEADITTSKEVLENNSKVTNDGSLVVEKPREKTNQDEVNNKSRKRKSEDVDFDEMKRKLVPVSSDVLSSFTGAWGQKVFPTENKQKARIRPQNKVNDKSKYVSKWTFKMFAEYFDFRKYVKELKLSSSELDENLTNEIYYHYMQALSLNNITLKDVKNHPLKESDARILFDGLLLRVCRKHDVRLHTEEDFQLSSLPSGKFDYLLITNSSKPFGCIETKSPSSLDTKAFVQAVLQLCSLQQIASKSGIAIETTPVFCILTDSYRFVFIQLMGRELRLEHELKDRRGYVRLNQPPEKRVLKLRHLEAKDDFTDVIGQISEVIKASLKLI